MHTEIRAKNKELEELNTKLSKKVKELEVKLGSIKSEIKSELKTELKEDIVKEVLEVMEENKENEEKKSNLVIYNIEETHCEVRQERIDNQIK